MKLSVIIAAYNEERTVATIVERVRSVPLEIEIIAVNDGSGDRTGGRTYAEGKKIGWRDGVAALWHIVRFNLFPPAKKIAFRPSPSAATD